ncbi:MAG: DUF4956 domain-containing protein [Defluviitaleaceae bacterium]|nr:DUF4956 domain-containing protein [Defluviitaleaceae bacterium]MCL2275618.1 DUF4956 domain-containing protein [Defluviitaleaceae bacterium]
MGRFEALQEILGNPYLYVLEEISPIYILFTLGVAAFCGLVVYLVYRFFNRNVLYSESFNLLIVMVSVVTAFIILTIGTNLVLSLGMVGALSIVRFRAAVKDPLDVGFLFWGVAAGLTAGAGMHAVALMGTAFVAVIYILFFFVRLEKRAFLLILRYSPTAESTVNTKLSAIKYTLKNKTHNTEYTELTAEVKIKGNEAAFLQPLREIEGVDNVVLVEYTGDYA